MARRIVATYEKKTCNDMKMMPIPTSLLPIYVNPFVSGLQHAGSTFISYVEHLSYIVIYFYVLGFFLIRTVSKITNHHNRYCYIMVSLNYRCTLA